MAEWKQSNTVFTDVGLNILSEAQVGSKAISITRVVARDVFDSMSNIYAYTSGSIPSSSVKATAYMVTEPSGGVPVEGRASASLLRVRFANDEDSLSDPNTSYNIRQIVVFAQLVNKTTGETESEQPYFVAQVDDENSSDFMPPRKENPTAFEYDLYIVDSGVAEVTFNVRTSGYISEDTFNTVITEIRGELSTIKNNLVGQNTGSITFDVWRPEYDESRNWSSVDNPDFKPVGGKTDERFNRYDENGINVATGGTTHSEGYNNIIAYSASSHVEGESNYVGDNPVEPVEQRAIVSHVEGRYNTALVGWIQHVEGICNQSTGYASHTEGEKNVNNGRVTHVEGTYNTALSGSCNSISGDDNTIQSGDKNSVSGHSNTIQSGHHHIVGGDINTVTSGNNNIVSGSSNTVEASNSIISGSSNTVESGGENLVIGRENTHSTGSHNIVSGLQNTNNGENNIVSGRGNNAERITRTILSGFENTVNTDSLSSIISGHKNTVTNANAVIVEGQHNVVQGAGSFASIVNGISNTIINSMESLVQGETNSLVESPYGSVIFGKSNSVTESKYTFTLGLQNTVYQANGTVIYGFYNRVSMGNDNSLIGGQSNTVYHSEYTYVSGNKNNADNSDCSVISGSSNTTSTGVHNIILSGYHNSIVNEKFADNYAGRGLLTGSDNSVVDMTASLLSGRSNDITCTVESIIAGYQNTVTRNSVYPQSEGLYRSLIVGYSNTVTQTNDSVIAGIHNSIQDYRPHGYAGEVQSTQNNLIAGHYNVVNGLYSSVLIGYQNSVTDLHDSIVSGRGNTVTCENNGAVSTSNGVYAFSRNSRYTNYEHPQLGLGINHNVTGKNDAVIGRDLISSHDNQLVIGKFNEDVDLPFVIGGGTSDSDRKNILTLDWNGTLKLHGDIYVDQLYNIDGSKKVFGGDDLDEYIRPSIGEKSLVANYAVDTSTANGDGAFVMNGGGSIADGNWSTITGADNKTGSTAEYAFVSGSKNTANGKNSAVFGVNNVSESPYSFVFGNKNTTDSSNAVFVGGNLNKVFSNSNYSAIITGVSNNISDSSDDSIITSGQNNEISNNCNNSSIIGGNNNSISTNSSNSTILGGNGNSLITSQNSLIASGLNNKIYGNYDLILSCTDSQLGREYEDEDGDTQYVHASNCVLLGGQGLRVPDNASYLIVAGRFNDYDYVSTGNHIYRFIIGGGTRDDDRKNVFGIDAIGNVFTRGDFEHSVDDKLNSAVNRISELETQLATALSTIETLQSMVTTLTSDLATLRTDMTTRTQYMVVSKDVRALTVDTESTYSDRVTVDSNIMYVIAEDGGADVTYDNWIATNPDF